MSNEQRETKEIKVGNHVLIVNTYITGREARNIEGAIIDQLEISQSAGEGQKVEGLKGAQLKDRQDMQIKSVVVSVNGKNENVVDLVLDLPSDDSEKIMELVIEIAEPKKETASN